MDTPSIAISGTLITKNSHTLIRNELRSDCELPNKDPVQCDMLEDCYKVWEEMVGDIGSDDENTSDTKSTSTSTTTTSPNDSNPSSIPIPNIASSSASSIEL
jgi:hypothetical protein